MNAALRAFVRTAIKRGVQVFGICEICQGMLEGGDRIRALGWDDIGGTQRIAARRDQHWHGAMRCIPQPGRTPAGSQESDGTRYRPAGGHLRGWQLDRR